MYDVNLCYHIWFKVCKPFRGKYNLSVNVMLVLNGCYCYCKYKNRTFTQNQLFTFVRYFNSVKIGRYIKVLMLKGYIKQLENRKTREIFTISDQGIDVINELNQSYDSVYSKFISDNGICL